MKIVSNENTIFCMIMNLGSGYANNEGASVQTDLQYLSIAQSCVFTLV